MPVNVFAIGKYSSKKSFTNFDVCLLVNELRFKYRMIIALLYSILGISLGTENYISNCNESYAAPFFWSAVAISRFENES